MGRLFTDALVEAVADGVAPTTGNGGPYTAVNETTNFTARASIDTAHTGTKSLRILKGVTAATGNGNAQIASLSFPSNWNETYVDVWYRPDTMVFTAGAVHSIVMNQNHFAIIADHTSGIKVRAQINGGGGNEAQTSLSAALTNQTWNHLVAIFRRVSATQVAVRFFVNDVEVGTEQTATHTPWTTWGGVRVGVANTIPSPGTINNTSKFYIDDLSIVAVEAVPTGVKAIRLFGEEMGVELGDVLGGLDDD